MYRRLLRSSLVVRMSSLAQLPELPTTQALAQLLLTISAVANRIGISLDYALQFVALRKLWHA